MTDPLDKESAKDVAAEKATAAKAQAGKDVSAVSEKAGRPVKPAAKKEEAKPWPYPAMHYEPKDTSALDALKARFAGSILAVGDMSGKPVAYVAPTMALDILTHCRHTLGFDHLPFVSGCDYPDENVMEVHWQLFSYTDNRSLAVKAHVPRDAAEIPSVTGLWAGADWHEREAWDLLGIKFTGHPDLRRRFMPEGWRGHPLRKDYDRSPQYIGMNDKGENVVYDTPGPYRW